MLSILNSFSFARSEQAALDELNRLFETRLRSDEGVKMIEHDNQFV